MRVLIACEFSGVVREAFRALGHDAWSCDLLPAEDCSQFHIQADFRRANQESWDFVGYHYECRVMANSGVRWLYNQADASNPGDATGRVRNESRWRELDEACAMFNLTLRDSRPGYAENSIMHCHAKRLIDREQDQVIQPWQHGHGETKATCLWLRGLPLLKASKVVDGRQPRVHFASPGVNRWKERSRTLPGIAAAMAAQWGTICHDNNVVA